jgi:hypothetical protein
MKRSAEQALFYLLYTLLYLLFTYYTNLKTILYLNGTLFGYFYTKLNANGIEKIYIESLMMV